MLETALTPDDFHCDRKTTCCFTGHRKRSLPDSGDAFAVKIKALKSHIGFLNCFLALSTSLTAIKGVVFILLLERESIERFLNLSPV